MSLLMDALKKAEQEKREAAKKLKSPDQEPSLARGPDSAGDTASGLVPDSDMTGPEPHTPEPFRVPPGKSLPDLSLEPMELRAIQPPPVKNGPARETAPPAEEEPEDSGRFPVLMSAEEITPPEEPDADRVDDTQAISLPPVPEQPALDDADRTFHGVHLEKSFAAGLYEDTVQGEVFKPDEPGRSYDETLPGVPAAQLARDIGTLDQPTPVAAQTIFTAGDTARKPSAVFKGVLVALCGVAVLSALIFVYTWTTPITRDIPSPMVARGVETTMPGQPPLDLTAANAARDAAADTVAGPTRDGEGPALDPSPAAASTQAGELTPSDAAAGSPAESIEPPQAESNTAIAGGPDGAGESALPAYIQPPPAMIRITRSAGQADEDRLVREAYEAYQSGDYALARSRYEEAYAAAPGNRDVLLGLAALALRNGNRDRAEALYLRLLQLNPLDNVARAAVLGLRRDAEPSIRISSIKNMLYDSPDQPLLHFTLGKLQATQAHWAEAQQAFFEAYRLDSANPDYALNLAISLDRLGQPRAALDYYNVALELSRSTAAGFDVAAVEQRIRALEAR